MRNRSNLKQNPLQCFTNEVGHDSCACRLVTEITSYLKAQENNHLNVISEK